jgi:hypothetical protein
MDNYAPDKKDRLKKGIWIYFLLLIFEGALRKWLLPGLATPLLVVRDPFALWLIYESSKIKIIPLSIYLRGIIAIGLIAIYTAIFIGHGSVVVALYGARILLIHVPLIFVIGVIFDHQDLLKIGRWTLWIALPMAVLTYLQFKSPQSAWVNRGVGGDVAGAGFSGSGDFFRPPGTFSFTTGVSLFFGWLAPFVFYFWLNPKLVNRWLLIFSTIALLVAIPISISRTLLFEVLVTFAFTLVAAVRKPENIQKVFLAVFLLVIAVVVLSQTAFYQVATGAFTDRFTSANEQEGGLVKGVFLDRFLGGLIESLSGSSDVPFFGYGLGMGTNVGSQLLFGKQAFVISEGAWGQHVGELGPIMGMMIILGRIALAFEMLIFSFKKLASGEYLPWLLTSFGFLIIMQATWAQPTSLGFCVMIGGLIMASLKGEADELNSSKLIV